MILHNLINEHLHSATSKLILYAILEKAEFEKKNTIKIEQTYLAELCNTSAKTVNRELKYLEEENYLTFQRSIYNNLTTTQITLTEKSVNLINGNTSTEKQNKAQISTKTNQSDKDIIREKKIAEKADKQPKTKNNNKVEQTTNMEQNIQQHYNIQELKNEYSKLDRIQRDCLKVISSCTDDSYLQLYVDDAKENNVSEQLIQFALNKRKEKMIQLHMSATIK